MKSISPKTNFVPQNDSAELLFLLDDNLGFRDGAFLERCNEKVSIVKLSDLDSLVSAIKREVRLAAYVPVAIAFEFRNDPTCHPLATALVGKTGSTTTSSLWIVRRDNKVEQIEELKGTRYGRINRFCTSSYLAPAILLKKSGYSIDSFFSEVIDVSVEAGDWQRQVDQVVEGKIDSTMVSEAAWLAKPDNAKRTKIIGKKTGLPCPVVLIKAHNRFELSDRILPCFLNQKVTVGDMFSGFARNESEPLEAFFKEIESSFG